MIKIDDKKIGSEFAPYIIAEMSGNHNGDINRAIKLIEAAKEAGADAVKLQTYTADTITINHNSEEFMIKGGLWDGYNLHKLYEKAHTPWDWHPKLFERGRELGITVFSSPFDYTAVDFLEELKSPAYKIASFEMTDLPLVRYIAQKGKPVIMSTGMATKEEIQESMSVLKENGCHNPIVLHCISGYPTPLEDANLKTIPDMIQTISPLIGLSDHTKGIEAAIAAVALGACVIEKHFTLSRADGGVDSEFSLEPHELKALCVSTKNAWKTLGKVDYTRKASEKPNLVFRRSLYIVKDIKAGEPLTSENVRSIRPGYGLEPKYYDDVLGKTVNQDISRGTALEWTMVK